MTGVLKARREDTVRHTGRRPGRDGGGALGNATTSQETTTTATAGSHQKPEGQGGSLLESLQREHGPAHFYPPEL